MHEIGELCLVELAVRAQSAADIHSKRRHLSDRLSHVLRIEATRRKDRNVHRIANFPAHAPVVRAAGAAEDFGRERWVPESSRIASTTPETAMDCRSAS